VLYLPGISVRNAGGGKFILRIQFAAPLFSEIKGVAEHDIRL
jgi:hypothetical protein